MPTVDVKSRIAMWFVGLSSIVYIAPTLLSGYLFYLAQTHAIDEQLRLLGSSLGHAIDLKAGRPHFRDWARIVQTDPKRSLFTIQLFDDRGTLLEHFGVEGIPTLLPSGSEQRYGNTAVRTFVSPLNLDAKVVGYLQLQNSTSDRDSALRNFVFAMVCMGPVVLLGLGVCSYYVADKATVSIRKNLEMLKQFTADAGHELNTPLSIINASAESLQRKLLRQGVDLKDTEIIVRSAERMQKIIDDMALLAEVEQSAVSSMEMNNVKLEDLLEQALLELDARFEQRSIALRHTPIPEILITGNEDALRRMFYNLLDNAHKYTEPGGVVELDVCDDGNSVSVTIWDTGIGIANEDLPHIFDRFYRSDKSRSRSSGGSGLGLAIAKAIAHAHHGEIAASSRTGAGSKFVVTLPIAAANSVSRDSNGTAPWAAG